MNKTYFQRHDYIRKIKPYLGKKIIKVIVGMRRVGKSYFLKQLKDYLLGEGMKESHFLLVDMENIEFDFIKNYKDFAAYVDSYFKNVSGKKILFVDEIQDIIQWEKAIRSYFNKEDFDIVITGSNAHLLSSEIATYLTGRTIEINMYPLSFQEFLKFNHKTDTALSFREYLKYGGMPTIYDFHLEEGEKRYELLKSLYNTILLKDVIARYSIRNVSMLNNLIGYVFDNIGNIFSSKKIVDYLKSQKLSITVDTVRSYLIFLEAAFAIHKVNRYDIRGKRLLEVGEKYYVSDLGLRHCLLGYRDTDIGSILENVVYLELKRRGYIVYVGKFNDKEIDFIAEREGKKLYIQVTFSLATPEIISREFASLLEIEDNFPKFVLSMDEVFNEDMQGVRWVNIKEFLLQTKD